VPLKKVSPNSNMYQFVTDTWTPVRGDCPYDCSYCYVKGWGKPAPLHLMEAELRADMGQGNFIFICSGCDLFHPDVPLDWINKVRDHTLLYPGNTYLWHTKNPYRLVSLIEPGPSDIACVTIESNRGYPLITKAPPPIERIKYLCQWEGKRMVTVEPVLDFDLDPFIGMILEANPMQVNIGADSGGNNLPEPPREKIKELINRLGRHTEVHLKKNIYRIFPESRYYGNP